MGKYVLLFPAHDFLQHVRSVWKSHADYVLKQYDIAELNIGPCKRSLHCWPKTSSNVGPILLMVVETTTSSNCQQHPRRCSNRAQHVRWGFVKGLASGKLCVSHGNMKLIFLRWKFDPKIFANLWKVNAFLHKAVKKPVWELTTLRVFTQTFGDGSFGFRRRHCHCA